MRVYNQMEKDVFNRASCENEPIAIKQSNYRECKLDRLLHCTCICLHTFSQLCVFICRVYIVLCIWYIWCVYIVCIYCVHIVTILWCVYIVCIYCLHMVCVYCVHMVDLVCILRRRRIALQLPIHLLSEMHCTSHYRPCMYFLSRVVCRMIISYSAHT